MKENKTDSSKAENEEEIESLFSNNKIRKVYSSSDTETPRN